MIEKFKGHLNKETAILVGIFLMAYLLRILPYLLGYNLPFTDDGMRDFDQVLYIIENGRINFFDYPFYFGSFPILHLLIFFISRFGFDPLTTFLFVPQIFPSLGLVFFYLFLKRYFSSNQSLLAIFLIAIFGPHIHWSAQPVRETMGLFFFPLIIYLFDQVFNNFELSKKSIQPVLLMVSFALMIFSHHWSSLMLFLTLLIYSLVFIKNKKIIFFALLSIIAFFLAALTYWLFVFEIAYELIGKAINFSLLVPVIIFLFVVFVIFIERFKTKLNLLKNKIIKITYFILIIFFLLFISFNFSPASYPVQIFVPLMIYALLLGVGFFYSSNENINSVMFLNLIYLGFFAVATLYFSYGVTLYDMPFDPFRTVEFAIFPSSIIVAYGLLIFKENFSKAFLPLVVFLVLFSTLIYPPIFTYGKRLDNTIFYDVRSDVRQVSISSQKLIDWAHKNNFSIYSPRPEVKMYQRVFHHPKRDNLVLLSENDLFLKKNFDFISDPIIKVDYLLDWQYNINYEFVLIKEGHDYLIVPSKFIDLSSLKVNGQIDDKVLELLEYFDKDNGGLQFIGQVDLLDVIEGSLLYLDARFIYQDFLNSQASIGEIVKVTFVVENTSNFTWNTNSNIFLRDLTGYYSMELPHNVDPGETISFQHTELIKEPFTPFSLKVQMYKEGFGYFGEQSSEIKITFQ